MTRLLRPVHAAGLGLALVLAACSTAATPSPTQSQPTPTTEPTSSAAATAEPTDSPSAEPSASASLDAGAGFEVIANPEADALFLDRNTCQNLESGYEVDFPAEWNANAEFGPVSPCSWFSPTEYSADDPAEVPPEVAITIEYLEGDSGSFDDPVSREEVVVGMTQDAVRVEYDDRYLYAVQLGPTPEEGPNLLVQTTSQMGGDFELNKAVLDRMMATMEFIGTVQ